MGLGINKDLEPLARRVKRDGGSVTFTGATHLVWTLPNGRVIRTGLTMSGATAEAKRREIVAALDEIENGTPVYEVHPVGRGKYQLLHLVSRQPLLNNGGYPRTFSDFGEAKRTAKTLR